MGHLVASAKIGGIILLWCPSTTTYIFIYSADSLVIYFSLRVSCFAIDGFYWCSVKLLIDIPPIFQVCGHFFYEFGVG